MCEGVYEDYYKAVGMLYCKFSEWIEEMKRSGCKVAKKEEWFELEAEAGWGWRVTYEDGDKDTYYLLINEEEKERL